MRDKFTKRKQLNAGLVALKSDLLKMLKDIDQEARISSSAMDLVADLVSVWVEKLIQESNNLRLMNDPPYRLIK